MAHYRTLLARGTDRRIVVTAVASTPSIPRHKLPDNMTHCRRCGKPRAFNTHCRGCRKTAQSRG